MEEETILIRFFQCFNSERIEALLILEKFVLIMLPYGIRLNSAVVDFSSYQCQNYILEFYVHCKRSSMNSFHVVSLFAFIVDGW